LSDGGGASSSSSSLRTSSSLSLSPKAGRPEVSGERSRQQGDLGLEERRLRPSTVRRSKSSSDLYDFY
jgi:hypothetical protein